MTAILAALGARFNALPFKLIAGIAVAGMIGLALFAVYREGRHAGDEAAAVALAKHNAEIAAKFMRDSRAAQTASAADRARADAAALDLTTLKEQINAVAKGNASAGCLAAIRGLQPRSTQVGKPAVPGGR